MILKYFFSLFGFNKKSEELDVSNYIFKKSKSKKPENKVFFFKPKKKETPFLSIRSTGGGAIVKDFSKKKKYVGENLDITENTHYYEFLVRRGIHKYFQLNKKNNFNALLSIQSMSYFFVKNFNLSTNKIKKSLIRERILNEKMDTTINLYDELTDSTLNNTLSNLLYNTAFIKKSEYAKKRKTDNNDLSNTYSNKKKISSFEKYTAVGYHKTKPAPNFFYNNPEEKFIPKKPSFSFIKKYAPAFKDLALKKKKGLKKMWSLEV